MDVCILIMESCIVSTRIAWCIIQSLVKWFLPKRYKDISNDTILITGGGKGIGRQLAVELANHKPKQIILWGRHEDTLAATSKIVRLKNVSCGYMVCDVSDRHQIYIKANQMKEIFGSATILINNAGIVYGDSLLESKEEDLMKTIEVNTLSHCWIYKAFVPSMLQSNHGHIVNINSVLGMMGLSGAAGYCTSKSASMALTESLMCDIQQRGKTGVHVTSVHPYMVNTEMFAGCTTRFPFLFPPLHLDYVAWKITDAILTNQHMVLMPRIMYVLWWIKSLLPVDAYMITQRFCGVDKTMQSFHKRTIKKES